MHLTGTCYPLSFLSSCNFFVPNARNEIVKFYHAVSRTVNRKVYEIRVIIYEIIYEFTCESLIKQESIVAVDLWNYLLYIVSDNGIAGEPYRMED